MIDPSPRIADFDPPPVSLLYVPGHKSRALDKAQGLAADMLVIDLEDAVPAALKAEARAGAAAALTRGFPGKLVAIRINAVDSIEHRTDWDFIAGLPAAATPDALVIPKVEDATTLRAIAERLDLPLLPMIETPAGIYAAREIAGFARTIGLIAGLNDLAHALRLPDPRDRSAMTVALQAIVLAARAAGVLAFDGVYNAIDDATGFALDAADGHRLGFDGKTLIHPAQVDACNLAFAPDAARLAAAQALIAAATGGAERFDGSMVEDMHVADARRLIDREALRNRRRLAMTQP